MELLNQAIDSDFALETVFSKSDDELPGKIKKLESERKEAFRIAIQALLQNQENLDYFAAVVMLFDDPKIKCELFDKNSNSGANLLINMEKAEKIHAKYIFDKAEQLYKRATSADKNYPYKFRNDWLMKAIKLLMDSVEDVYDIPDNDKLEIEWKAPFTGVEGMQYKICILLSKCYFKRGLSILPKGKGVSPPEKKVEAMRKALKWADAAIQENKSLPEPLFFKIKILYELYKISDQEYHEKLKAIADIVLQIVSEKSLVPRKISDLHVLNTCCRFSNKQYDDLEKYDRLILNADTNNNDPSFSLCMMKAQAGLRIYKNISAKKDVLEKLILNTEKTVKGLEQIELFSTIWDEVIDLIRDLKDEKIDGWQKLAMMAWEICDDKERQMGCGLEIRQYWSRLERLYHLAIEGADSSSIQKVCVIDSLKGRSLLAWNDVDVFLQKKGDKADEIRNLRKLFYESEANALMGNYVGQHLEIRSQLTNIQKRASLPVDKIPIGWTALHFYLQESEDEKLECRCIAGCKSGNTEQGVEWIEFGPYDLTKVWAGYKKWRDKYYGLADITESSECLNKLCELIGDRLPFLFDEEKIKTNGIIFIPHGFMHLLPLHAAKAPASANWNCEYLFQRKVSTYLPAWSHIHNDMPTHCVTSDEKYCCRNVDKSPKDKFYKNLIEYRSWTEKVDHADKNVFTKFATKFKKSPDCLTVLCHGLADEVFPINSILKLGYGGLSLIELQMADLNLTGTKVLLGACESELAPIKTTQIDEHLSLAGTFLSKGASLVFGSMWECKVPVAEELILEALKKGINVYQMLQEKQKDWITSEKAPESWPQGAEIFKGYPNSLKLYFIAPFKITGYPLPI